MHNGAVYTNSADCDGDGVPDPHCIDTAGTRGFLGSSSGCANNWGDPTASNACNQPPSPPPPAPPLPPAAPPPDLTGTYMGVGIGFVFFLLVVFCCIVASRRSMKAKTLYRMGDQRKESSSMRMTYV